MTVELGFFHHFNPAEARDTSGQWSDGTPGPGSLGEKARAYANSHPDVQRLVNQSRAAHAAGDHQRGHQLWQQASDLAAQKIQDYKDNEAMKSFQPTAWEKAHPKETAARRRSQEQEDYGSTSSGGSSYGGGPNGGMDELSRSSGRSVDLAGGSYRPPRMPAYKPTSGMRKGVSASMRKLAAGMKERHPDMGSHVHISAAAQALDRNEPSHAIRHLNAAIGNMTPQSLRRHGLLTDDQHDAAKRSMDAIHHHLLLVKDIQDTQERNNQLPHSELPEPRNPQGSDDLTDKPSARPGEGGKAMNAPDTANVGRIDINVSKPQQVTNPKSASQIAASNGDLTTAIELVGPKGYEHGWKYVGPGSPPGARSRARNLKQQITAANPIAAENGQIDEARGYQNPYPAKPALDVNRGAVGPGEAALKRIASAQTGWRAALGSYDRAVASGKIGFSPGSKFADTYGGKAPTGAYWNQFIASKMQPSAVRLANVDLGHHYDPGEKRDRHGEWSGDGLVKALNKAAASHGTKAIRERERNSSRSRVGREDIASLAKIMSRPLPRAIRKSMKQYGSGPTRHGAPMFEFSAQTPALASTPHPFGKPGGPGLWHQKGMELPPYIQNIARAILRQGRAKDLGEAIAIAKSSTSKWAATSKHPEVRAASSATNADWEAKRARAHAHANVSALARAIELTGTAAGAAKDTHVAAGSAAGGQFGSGSGAAGGAQSAANSKASQKAALLKQAAGLRAQAAAKIRQIALLKKALKGTTAKQAGAVTAAKKAVTPAAAKTTAKTPAATAAAKAATAATPAGQAAAAITAAGKAVTPAQVAAVQQRMSQAQIKTQITALTKQVTALLTQAAALTAQAAKL